MKLLRQRPYMTRDQFAVQWETSREKFYRFAYCYVKNEPDAMELLSEATYRAFCSLDTLRAPEAFDAWMCTILVRCAYGFLKQRNRFVPYEDARETLAGDESGLTDLRLDVYRLMDRLSTEERTLLILRFFQERSLEEIAGIMELPLNTVKSKLYRSLKKMRNMEQEADQHV